MKKKTWNALVMNAFVNKALQVHMPTSTNWYGEDWYAEAVCKFQHTSGIVEIPIILKIFTDEQKRSKWIITGVRQNSIEEIDQPNPLIKSKKLKFINPASHGNNFIELYRGFEDKANLTDYFEDAFFSSKRGNSFYQDLLKDRIKFIAVKEVKYHFLNVDDFIFTVEYFQREGLNSGWLINTLKDATINDKVLYIKTLLGK